jgi:hypothetical protein
MLRAYPLANVEILPQARQGSYFFNRIGQKLTTNVEDIDLSHRLLIGYEATQGSTPHTSMTRSAKAY